MKISEILKLCEKPQIYSPSTSTMWTDPYISRNLLQIHLDPETDLASRKPDIIQKTSEWILSQLNNHPLKIADLGCGPGLYCELFAKKGHSVTGVDFSTHSIAYAQKSATEKGLEIEYRNENYVNLGLEQNTYDLVTLIYTDFGVLLPEDRCKVLSHVHRVLKPGGLFIFDVSNNKQVKEKLSSKTWECMNSGFWKEKPYLCLSDSFYYEEEEVILFQHTIFTDDSNPEIYRFWTHLFSHDKLKKILMDRSFDVLSFNEKIIPEGGTWNGDNVTFTVAQKR